VPRREVELWTLAVGLPHSTVRQARQAEEEGWDGIGVVDSQNLAADPYVEMVLAAQATSTLKIGTAVTNPLTRHPAVTAAAIATVQAESDGRALLGIGRGDSALAHLGLAPAPVAVFERYVERVQGYLRGEELPFDVAHDGRGEVVSADALGMAGGPTGSQLHWLRPQLAKVPVDVAASGPKVIALAARLAERVTLAVGADVERIRWAIELVRATRVRHCLAPDAVGLGAYVPVYVHPDRATARQLVAGGVASYARFSVMHGRVNGPVDDRRRVSLEAVHAAYDMNHHFTAGSPQSAALTDEVIDTFGVAGPASYCIERLQELVEAGLTKLFVMGGGDRGRDSSTAGADEARDARRRLVDEVLPALC
jgi:5,10-methylenetetrahydromethanopterin reductase